MTAAADEARRTVDRIRAEHARHGAAIAAAAAAGRRLRAEWEDARRQEVADAVQAADRALVNERKGVAANLDELVVAAAEVAQAAADAIAPGHLGAEWSAPEFASVAASPGSGTGVRLGSWRRAGGHPVRVCLPLVHEPGWLLDCTDASAAELYRHVVLRLLFHFTPAKVRVVCYDPDLTADIGLFNAVRDRFPRAVPPALTDLDALESELAALLALVSAAEDDLSARGQQRLLDDARHTGHLEHPIVVLVINGAVSGLSDRGRARLDQLLRVGPDRGLVVLVRAGAVPDPPTELIALTESPDGWTAGDLPVTWQPDPVLAPDRVAELVAVLAGAPPGGDRPPLGFDELVGWMEDRWIDAGDHGVEAFIGTAQGRPGAVRLRSENPPMPNAIIGGAVGQGKSNLLLVLVHALAARYAPTDLEMLLLDLKDGVEFGRLGPDDQGRNWLPHATVIGLAFDLDFAISVLESLVEEAARRAQTMRDAKVSTLSELRQRGGSLPRLLLVVDEFQRLFEGDEERSDRAASLLEQLARTGRSYGIHLVLASQTVSGIRGLAARGDAIFGQFHNRLSMRNTPGESQAVLAPGNTAAAQLDEVGLAVVNDALGDPGANRVVRVAHGDADVLRTWRQRWWREAAAEPPLVFHAEAHASWQAAEPYLSTPEDTGVHAAVGAPISVRGRVREAEMLASADQAGVVLGQNERNALPTLARMVSSALTTSGIQRVTILDGLSGPGSPTAAGTARLVSVAEQAGASVEVVGRQQMAADLARLGAGASERCLVVTLGLDAAVELEVEDPETYRSPLEDLRRVLQLGSLSGTFVLGWWRSRSRLESLLGYGAPSVRSWVLADVAVDDLRAICGPLARPPQGTPRQVFYDRNVGSVEYVVPFGHDLWSAP